MTYDTARAADLRIARRAIGINQRIQCVGSGGQWPINVSPSTGATGFTRSEGQFKFQIGPKRVRELRYAFANFYHSSSGEFDGIDFTLSAALIQGSSTVRWLGIGGNKQPVISAGSPLVITDPYFGDLDAGSIWEGRAGALFAANAQVPVGRQRRWASGTEKYFDSAAVASQVFSGSTFSQPAGGAVSNWGFGPCMILGIPSEPHPSIAIYGDSIAFGQSDTANNAGQIGVYEKGLANVFVGGISMPFSNMSRSGDVFYNNGLDGAGPTWPFKSRIRAAFGYHSDVLVALGHNDIASASNISLATMQNALLSIVAGIRTAGARAHVATILPHTVDASNAAIYVPAGDATAFQPGGKRDQWNAGLHAMLAAGTIDGVVDCCSTLEDPLNPGFFVQAGLTADGLHLNAAGTAIGAPVVNTWAKTLQALP